LQCDGQIRATVASSVVGSGHTHLGIQHHLFVHRLTNRTKMGFFSDGTSSESPAICANVMAWDEVKSFIESQSPVGNRLTIKATRYLCLGPAISAKADTGVAA
jgi:hypothetical protein